MAWLKFSLYRQAQALEERAREHCTVRCECDLATSWPHTFWGLCVWLPGQPLVGFDLEFYYGAFWVPEDLCVNFPSAIQPSPSLFGLCGLNFHLVPISLGSMSQRQGNLGWEHPRVTLWMLTEMGFESGQPGSKLCTLSHLYVATSVPLEPSWNSQLIMILGMGDWGHLRETLTHVLHVVSIIKGFFSPSLQHPSRPPLGFSSSLSFHIGSSFPLLMSGVRLKCAPMHFSSIWQVS